MSQTSDAPEELAERIRRLIPAAAQPQEKRMFGGLAFMVAGKMAVAIRSGGAIMVRLDPEHAARVVQAGDAAAMEMRGRSMRGWVTVEAAGDDDLRAWVSAGVTYALSLTA